MKLFSSLIFTAFLFVLAPMTVSAQCPDTDSDGVCDSEDPCPLDRPDDTDSDGLCDSDDPCPLDASNSCEVPTDCSSVEEEELRGLCNAYCEATNCDGEHTASDRACNTLLGKYIVASEGEMPPCVQEPEPPQQPELCSETCSFTGDGDCDDGGPGYDYSSCDLGTDCTDCGVRCPEGMVPDSNNSGFCTFAL